LPFYIMGGKKPAGGNRSRQVKWLSKRLPEQHRGRRITDEAIERSHGFASGLDIALTFKSSLDSGRSPAPKRIADYIKRFKSAGKDGRPAAYKTPPSYLLGRFAVVFGDIPELLKAAEMLGINPESAAKQIREAAQAKTLSREIREAAQSTKFSKTAARK
jgi:hypothetical protein